MISLKFLPIVILPIKVNFKSLYKQVSNAESHRVVYYCILTFFASAENMSVWTFGKGILSPQTKTAAQFFRLYSRSSTVCQQAGEKASEEKHTQDTKILRQGFFAVKFFDCLCWTSYYFNTKLFTCPVKMSNYPFLME